MQESLVETISVSELRQKLASGDLTCLALAEACIDRVEARERDVQAWTWFDPTYIRAEAERLDRLAQNGAKLGPLHGLPVGIKDVIDTAGIPTENGCALDRTRVPRKDADVVADLKKAGALVFGKTVTTELAFLAPGKTRNPINPDHTPGGSSSGSAAAVADSMVPLAIGTQTGGSVIRPASFCGVFGYKPSFGAISSQGVLVQSHSLDTVGIFARDLTGAALLADALVDMPGQSTALDAMHLQHRHPPTFAFVRPPRWEDATSELKEALDRLVRQLAAQVNSVSLPSIFSDVAQQRARINNAEMAHHFHRYVTRDATKLSEATQNAMAEGEAVSAAQYLAALKTQRDLRPALEPIFKQADVILSPSALGAAPKGLASTGDSIFNGLWTMSGNPALTLPLLQDTEGMPMGVQLVARHGEDAKLFAVAQWLLDWASSTGF